MSSEGGRTSSVRKRCPANRPGPFKSATNRCSFGVADGVMMWSSSAGPPSPDWPPRSAQVEMTSYVLLALFRRGNLVEGIELMKWLSEQRNCLGSYGTTQVTRHWKICMAICARESHFSFLRTP